jgi:hypothetical protein
MFLNAQVLLPLSLSHSHTHTHTRARARASLLARISLDKLPSESRTLTGSCFITRRRIRVNLRVD